MTRSFRSRSRALRFATIIAATPVAISLFISTPAAAQFGGIVYDPTNYAQNVLTAARTLQQVN
ncbi:P-type conjugative transfer protein TrbJ, partial [Escherichia coli]|nr:P-type conjugative transfer protein TrbJ [Escherichia coli]